MSVPKLMALFAFVLFSGIALMGWWKSAEVQETPSVQINTPIEVPLLQTRRVVEVKEALPTTTSSVPVVSAKEVDSPPPPDVDRIEELFRTTGKKLPIVETIIYKSHVNWNKGKRAWLSDYATHYHTSRHFIARSRNGKADYWKQELAEGDRINVLRPDLRLQFNLVIDLSRSKMWLYYYDLDAGQKELIKTYRVGVGRPLSKNSSELLTPTGQYLLGDRIATYKPGVFGTYNGAKVEMIRIFGTRWIPFSKEIGPSSASPRGLGIHGVPWKENEKGELAENSSSLGKYESDGCIRLSTEDIEELYAIVITKPCVVEITRDFHQAVFPVVESEINSSRE